MMSVRPRNVRFTRDTIKSHFQNNHEASVNQTISKVVDGSILIEDFPIIEVIKIGNELYSLDNRRLYMYRVLEFKQFLEKMQIKIISKKKLRDWKFRTRNDGKSIEVKNGETLEHAHAPPIHVGKKKKRRRARNRARDYR
ncbi:uncharacterized protein LOC144748209 [Ciona intestinalis]